MCFSLNFFFHLVIFRAFVRLIRNICCLFLILRPMPSAPRMHKPQALRTGRNSSPAGKASGSGEPPVGISLTKNMGFIFAGAAT